MKKCKTATRRLRIPGSSDLVSRWSLEETFHWLWNQAAGEDLGSFSGVAWWEKLGRWTDYLNLLPEHPRSKGDYRLFLVIVKPAAVCVGQLLVERCSRKLITTLWRSSVEVAGELDRPGKPIQAVRVNWKCLVGNLLSFQVPILWKSSLHIIRDVRDVESGLVIFKAFIAEATGRFLGS